MKTYAINLVTSTKNTDLYDKVAVNKFPIIVRCKSEAELKDMLNSEQSNGFVKQMLRTQKLFDESLWCIRSIYPDGSVQELNWKVADLNNVSY